MGTPEFAVPSLESLAQRHDVVAVFTQPDRPAGRGGGLQAPPVKGKALELGLPVCQPPRIQAEDAYERLARAEPQAIAVVGYGQMLPRRILALPERGCINVHSSLLPKYRGAAPVNWALARGETRTGVTTMRLAPRMDAGDILLVRATEIGPDETASGLNRRLAPIGAELLLETLARLEQGNLRPVPQHDADATRAPLLRREDGLIDWALPAPAIYNRLRGFDPWPGVFSFFRGKRLRILAARPDPAGGLPPGRLELAGRRLSVGCGQGRLAVDEVQLEGRKRLGALDFVRGACLAPDETLGHE